MIKINLLPQRYRISKVPVKKLFLSYILLLSLIFVLLYGAGEYFIWNVKQEIESVRHEYQLIIPIRDKMNFANEKATVINEKNNVLGQLRKDKKSWFAAYERLGRIIRPGIWLAEVSTVEKDDMIIKGQADSYDLVADFIKALAADSVFDKPVLINSEAVSNNDIKFEIKVKVK